MGSIYASTTKPTTKLKILVAGQVLRLDASVLYLKITSMLKGEWKTDGYHHSGGSQGCYGNLR